MRIALLSLVLSLAGCASTVEPCPALNGIYDVDCTIAGVYDNGNTEMWDAEHTLEITSGHLRFPRPSCETPLILAGESFVSGTTEPCVVDPYRTDTMRGVTGSLTCDGLLTIEIEQDVVMTNAEGTTRIERTWVCRGLHR